MKPLPTTRVLSISRRWASISGLIPAYRDFYAPTNLSGGWGALEFSLVRTYVRPTLDHFVRLSPFLGQYATYGDQTCT